MVKIGKYIIWQQPFGSSYDEMRSKLVPSNRKLECCQLGSYQARKEEKLGSKFVDEWRIGMVKTDVFIPINHHPIKNRIKWKLYTFYKGFWHHGTLWSELWSIIKKGNYNCDYACFRMKRQITGMIVRGLIDLKKNG